MAKVIKPAWMLFCLFLIVNVFSDAYAQTRTTDQILNYRGIDRTSVLIEGAKKEGEVVFYSAMIVNQALRPVADGFMKKYPFIKSSYWRADTADTMAKVSAEQKQWLRDEAARQYVPESVVVRNWLSSQAKKSAAKAAAKKAGRPYPNLVDNMRAARKK